jgi:hypothetical protein
MTLLMHQNSSAALSQRQDGASRFIDDVVASKKAFQWPKTYNWMQFHAKELGFESSVLVLRDYMPTDGTPPLLSEGYLWGSGT